VEKDNPMDLANKMLEFVEGKIGNIQGIINNGYETIQERYTWEIIGKQIYHQYISLVSKKK